MNEETAKNLMHNLQQNLKPQYGYQKMSVKLIKGINDYRLQIEKDELNGYDIMKLYENITSSMHITKDFIIY